MFRKSRVASPPRIIVHLSLFLGILVFLPSLVGLSWAEGPTASAKESTPQPSHQAHWDYMGIDGPEHWGMLDNRYMECEKGREQSPINIVTSHDPGPQSQLVFNYQSSPLHVINNGHTVQVSYKAGSTVLFDGKEYQLRQFHFHDPSEHHIEGKTFPMEMHLVHQNKSGHLLVVAVLIELGKTNAALEKAGTWIKQKLGHRVPIEGEEIRSGLVVNVKNLLPKVTNHFYSYHGSLTTPPCSEGVQWVVLKNHIEVSEQQVQRFVRTVGPNARPLQLPSGRLIEEQ